MIGTIAAALMTTIMYVGPRPRMTDPLYGTGEWSRSEDGETCSDTNLKQIPNDIARKMLKHGDVWIEATADIISSKFPGQNPLKSAPVVPADAEVKKDEDEESQDVRDAINAMTDKKVLANFIAANYSGMKISGKLSLENTKQEAIRIVDQFGVTP
jgi:hypothetical protein